VYIDPVSIALLRLNACDLLFHRYQKAMACDHGFDVHDKTVVSVLEPFQL